MLNRIAAAVRSAGLADHTTLVCTSYHGDHLGARGLQGKSTMHQASVSIRMI